MSEEQAVIEYESLRGRENVGRRWWRRWMSPGRVGRVIGLLGLAGLELARAGCIEIERGRLSLWAASATFFIVGAMLVRAMWRGEQPDDGWLALMLTRWECGACAIIGVCIFVSAVLGPRWEKYECPHGERWSLPWIGLARSDNGGPCRNGGNAPGERWHMWGKWWVFVPA